MTSDKSTIQNLIVRHKRFEECVLKGLRWEDQFTTLTCEVDYIYNDDGSLRPNLDVPSIRILRFQLVQDFRISSALNQSMCENPEGLDWGLNQFALVMLEDNPILLQPYASMDTPFSHVAFLWENARRLDVVFSSFGITDA